MLKGVLKLDFDLLGIWRVLKPDNISCDVVLNCFVKVGLIA
jgi:hypothetical protein